MRRKLFSAAIPLVITVLVASSAQAAPRDDDPWHLRSIQRVISKVLSHLPFVPNDGLDVPKP